MGQLMYKFLNSNTLYSNQFSSPEAPSEPVIVWIDATSAIIAIKDVDEQLMAAAQTTYNSADVWGYGPWSTGSILLSIPNTIDTFGSLKVWYELFEGSSTIVNLRVRFVKSTYIDGIAYDAFDGSFAQIETYVSGAEFILDPTIKANAFAAGYDRIDIELVASNAPDVAPYITKLEIM